MASSTPSAAGFDPDQLPEPGFARLRAVMAALRDAERGCPWDLEQSLASLRPFLVEESYELLDAIDNLGPAASATRAPAEGATPRAIAEHREELGDVLLQVVFQSRLAEEFGWFDVDAVARGIADKMVRRHPHVFRTETASAASTASEVVDQWQALKAAEGPGDKPRGALAGVPRQLPALLRAQRIGDKAARIGFDWRHVEGALAKVEEELAELREALAEGDVAAVEHELGDALFALTSVARHAEVDAEQSLRTTLDRFQRRFERVEARLHDHDGPPPDEATLERWWQAAKAELAGDASTT